MGEDVNLLGEEKYGENTDKCGICLVDAALSPQEEKPHLQNIHQ